MQALLDIILPVFVVIGLGYLATWRGLFPPAALDGLVRFTQSFAIPCLLFRAISTIDLGATLNGPLLASFYLGAFCCFALGYAGARRFFGRSPTDAVAIGFCCLFSNTILLGVPITERAYGPGALAGNFAIIAFHAPLGYLLGVLVMESLRNRGGGLARSLWRTLGELARNPFVIAIGLGFAVNLSGLPQPAPLAEGIDLIARAALPAALFGLGGILVQYRPEGDLKTIAMVCLVSLILHPALVWGAGNLLGLDRDGLRSAVLTAAMAPGVNTYIFANMYDAARRVAASSVLIATMASILTVWVWLMILP